MKENKVILFRRILYILLLGSIFLFPFLSFISLHLDITSHQQYVKKHLNESIARDTLFLSFVDYSKIADKDEITIKGKKYDALKVIAKTDSLIILLAKHDTYEELLIQKLIVLFEKDQSQESKVKLLTQPDWTVSVLSLPASLKTEFQNTEFIYTNLYKRVYRPHFIIPPAG